MVSTILEGYPYPRYYLDFETVQFAVPIWKGTRPYQQITFQWSCHIEDTASYLRHAEFLDVSGNDPAWTFATAMLATLGNVGPIFMYSSFERTQIKALAQRFPELAPALENVLERLVDLLPLTRNHYYHPDMKGSWSIKSVLPTIASDISYTELGEIQDGGMAPLAYLELIDPKTTLARKEALKHGLLAYCKLDTLAMVRLAHFLQYDSKKAGHNTLDQTT